MIVGGQPWEGGNAGKEVGWINIDSLTTQTIEKESREGDPRAKGKQRERGKRPSLVRCGYHSNNIYPTVLTNSTSVHNKIHSKVAVESNKPMSKTHNKWQSPMWSIKRVTAAWRWMMTMGIWGNRGGRRNECKGTAESGGVYLTWTLRRRSSKDAANSPTTTARTGSIIVYECDKWQSESTNLRSRKRSNGEREGALMNCWHWRKALAGRTVRFGCWRPFCSLLGPLGRGCRLQPPWSRFPTLTSLREVTCGLLWTTF